MHAFGDFGECVHLSVQSPLLTHTQHCCKIMAVLKIITQKGTS